MGGRRRRAKTLNAGQFAEARTVPRYTRNPYRALLQARFPKAFRPFGARKVPLKRGVYQDLRERCPDLGARQIHAGLDDYTDGPTYHKACVPNAIRIDLDGDAVGTVTLEESAYHADRLLQWSKWLEAEAAATQRRAEQARNSAKAMAESDPEYQGADCD